MSLAISGPVYVGLTAVGSDNNATGVPGDNWVHEYVSIEISSELPLPSSITRVCSLILL